MEKSHRSVLDDERIGRLLFKLALPSFFGMFVISLYNIVDTIFVGHYVGPLGIAGLSIVFPVQMLSLGVGMLTGMGGASLMSRLIGRRDIPMAEKVIGNAVTAAVICSLLMTVGGLINMDFWLVLMGSSESILPFAADYMGIVLAGIVFPTVAVSFNNLIRSEGNARVAMTGMIIGAVLNIGLDALFMIPMGMGITGAAVATVISQFISVLYYLWYYWSGASYVCLRLANLIPELRILRDIATIGIASFGRTMATSISAIFVNRTLIVLGGDFAVSAYGIVNRIMLFALMPGIVTGQGLQPILGFNHGAKRYDRALKIINLGLITATVFCTVVFFILFLFPRPFIQAFTSDASLVEQTVEAAKIMFFCLYLAGFGIVGSLVFQSVGKALQSFVTAISKPLLILILVLIMPRFMGLDGAWWAFPVADIITLILTVVLLIPLIREIRRKKRASETDSTPIQI